MYKWKRIDIYHWNQELSVLTIDTLATLLLDIYITVIT